MIPIPAARRVLSLCTVLFLAAPGTAAAQAQPPIVEPLTTAQAAALVDTVIQLTDSIYVVRERRAEITRALREGVRAGRYRVTDPRVLADRLTEDLQASGRDKHLGVSWDPQRYAAIRAEQGRTGPRADDDFFAQEAVRQHHGVAEMRILPGNLRYVRYTDFVWQGDETRAVLDGVMRFAKGGSALVLDLRDNGGGDGTAVQYLLSHFMPPSVQLVTFEDGRTGTREVVYTVDTLPTGRMIGKPLYVLVGDRTNSAAEEFAYHVRHFGLGTLVGRTTRGAAHNNTLLPVAPGFYVSLSFGRPVHAVTGSNWEGTGVPPHAEAAPGRELDQAQVLALTHLASHADEPAARAEYVWERVAAEARLRPAVVDAGELAGYAGRYGAERTIAVRDGGLVYQFAGRPDATLTPLGGGLFAIAGRDHVRMRFVQQDGRTVALETVAMDGSSMRHERRP